jgi:hypothetical protein
MMTRWIVAATWVFALSSTTAQAETPGEEDESHYGQQGQWEVGGSLDGSWSPDAFTLGLSPFIGYFLLERVELSLILRLDYENDALPAGGRSDAFEFSVLLEPSYHLPLSERLAVFAGVGVGYARAGGAGAFDLEPRVGLNIDVGSSGVITPEISVPILFARPTTEGGTGTTASLVFGAGFTTTF